MVVVGTAVAIAAAFYGYALFDDGPAAFYVLQGLLGSWCFGLMAYQFRARPAMQAMCLWGLFEQFQVAACGWADVTPDASSGMCMELIGPGPYAAVSAAVAILLWRHFRERG